MIVYYTGSTFSQVIRDAVEETEEVVYLEVIENEIDFQKYIKQDITKFGSVDTLIADVSSFSNTDEEIVSALDMLRTMYDSLKIILFAPYRECGDDLLSKSFNMGVLNIINTDDFREIRDELIYCIQTGKKYKDAVKYKDAKTEKVIVKHEVKKTVNKRLVAFAGSESNIGVTHNVITLANFLRKKGFMIAAVEMNDSRAFEKIADSFDERMFQGGYFTLNGVDFYPNATQKDLADIMSHSYNFILLDFGLYKDSDKVEFERAEDKFIITSSKPWELDAMNDIFSSVTKEVIQKYHICFNFTPETDYRAIKESMEEINTNIHFLKYQEDPFNSYDFADAEQIFYEFLPEKTEPGKKGLFDKLKRKKDEG